MKQLYSLKDAAAVLQRQPYQLVYLLTTGKVAEPLRVGGKRVFTTNDLQRLAKQLGIDNIDEALTQKGENDD